MATIAFMQSTSNRNGEIMADLTSELYTSQQNECLLFLRQLKDGLGLKVSSMYCIQCEYEYVKTHGLHHQNMVK
jgi:hypothetical protein